MIRNTTRRTGMLAVLLLLISATTARSEESQLSDAVLRRRLDEYLGHAGAEGFTGAVLVARGGRILVERGYGMADAAHSVPVTAETVFTTGSITKQFTAAAVLVLAQRGKLSLQEPISKYFQDVPADKLAITIDLLLSHRAGFPGAIGDDREPIGRDAYVRRALATPLEFAPGTGYGYSNVGYSLAAAIIEMASGESYEDFLHDALFAPAGMKQTGYRLPNWDPRLLAHGIRPGDGGDWGSMVEVMIADHGPGWNLIGNGGIQSTVGDMYLWDRALRGTTILTAASKRAMYAKHAEEPGGTWYGYGWSIEPTPWGEMVTHNGGNQIFFSDFLRFLEPDVVIYFSTSSTDPRMKRLARPLARIVFTGQVPQFEPTPEPLRAPGSEPAPAGSSAARWGLPTSPAGQRAAALLDALASTDDSSRRAFAADGFAPSMITRRGADALAGLLERMHGDLGTFTLRGYRPTESGGIVVVLVPGEGPGPMTIELEIEPGGTHRIGGLDVELGD